MKILPHGALPVALLAVLSISSSAQNPAPAAPAPAPAPPAAAPQKAETPAKDPLSPGTPAPEKPKGAEDKADVNALSEAEVDQALAAIRERYVNGTAFS